MTVVLGGSLSATAKRKSARKQATTWRRCKRQVAPCAAAVQALCDENDTEPEQCAHVIACCSFLANCDAGGFVACIGELEI